VDDMVGVEQVPESGGSHGAMLCRRP
jgi:hypothetical protein